MSKHSQVRIPPHIVAESDDGGLGAVDEVRVSAKRSNLWLDAWRDLRSNWMFWVSAVFIVVIVFTALFPSVFTNVPPNDGCTLAKSNAPPEPGHPLGFTLQGCDILSRIVHGTSTSLTVGLIVTAMVTLMGVTVGGLAGYFGGWLDSLLMRLGEMFFAIPYVLAAVVVMSMFLANRNILVISLAIGAFTWPATARILRAEMLRVKRMEYVLASEALGLSRFKTLVAHVLPNSITPVIVLATVGLAGAITAEATLSFLGVGLPKDEFMSWGNDIEAAQRSLRESPMPLIYPSIALSVTVLAFIMLGETVREALDPKARARR